jgi:hypothetical protein
MESIVFDINKNLKKKSNKNSVLNTNYNDNQENNLIKENDNINQKIENSNKNPIYLQYSYTSKKPIKVVENIYYFN